MIKLLWLDDFRDPKIFKKEKGLNEYDNIFWVKNYNDFIDWIKKNNLPDIIAFDHDLGDIDNIFNEKTGYDCAKWLIDYCIDNNKKLPKWKTISDNIVGAKNINLILKNYENFQKYKI